MSTTVNTSPCTLADTFRQFFTFFDERFEAYRTNSKPKMFIRDTLAGFIVALVAIPLGVGFSIASGMQPEQGIIAGAYAGLIGGIFGGSKFQVYGPTAAFITVIAGIIHQYDVPFMLLASVVAGLLIVAMGFARLGRFFKLVPHSVIVGFTMGIAMTIIISQLPDVLGAHGIKIPYHTVEKAKLLPSLFQDANAHAMILAVMTFFVIKQLYKITVYIPAPLIAIAIGAFIANNVWHDNFIPLVSTKYGTIGENLFAVTLPSLGSHSVFDLILPVTSILFIAALESLLSARMADRLANNQTPYNPDKELFGQGLVNAIVPIFNGFPCTGALARTATSIKVGAVSPVASLLKGSFVIMLMVFFASWLSILPMACVGGLLVFVGLNMVKPEEVKSLWAEGKFHMAIALLTAAMTLLTDLMIAVTVGTITHYALHRFFNKPSRPSPKDETRELVNA